MSAIFWSDQQNVRIFRDPGKLQRRKGNEGVVLAMNYQRRDAYAINQMDRARLMIVVVSAGETMGHSGEALVEISDRADEMDLTRVVELRVELFLYVDAFAQPAQKVLVVNPV